MLEPLDGERRVWEALVRPARKLKPGETLFAADGSPVVEIGQRTDAGDTFTVTLVGSVDSLDVLAEHGEMPLPPYITERLRRPRPLPDDLRPPARAARRHPPPACTSRSDLLDDLAGPRHRDRQGRARGRARHVPPDRHRRPARSTGCTPSATGCRSDTMRALPRTPSASSRSARPRCGRSSRRRTGGELEGRTDIFIHRGYEWQLVDLLMTNFHLPRTTLLMMIDAFVGERWRRLYAEALAERLPLPVVRRRDAARPPRLTDALEPRR